MYKPAPPRPKKTSITRTRTGCWDCRRRRVKCDERKPSLMLQANPADAVQFYSAAWDWQCIPHLALMLRTTDDASLLRSSPLFVDMMAAVSASHLSRTSPQPRLLMPTDGQNFRPDPAHESVSQEFYGSVMKKMARWSEQDFGAYPILGLAVLTLFCLVESSMGSFQAFGLHSDGAAKLIDNFATNALAQDAQACALLGPLVEVRMQMWWRRVYFGTPGFHRHRPKVSLDPELSSLTGCQSRRSSILLRLCESHRINNAAIIAHWDRYSDNLVEAKSAGNVQPRIDPFERMFGQEKERLDSWCQIYSFSGEMEHVQATFYATSATLEVHPLRMVSHTEAMDFAYYVASRVLQCPGPLDSLTLHNPEEIRRSYTEVESWICLLLRVVAGMNWKDCVRYNMYTIGITGVLLACLLRSHDLRIGLWCETWLQGCLDGSSFEEGSFPAFQTMSIIRLINKEHSNGRDVFGLFQTVEDGGGSGKFGSYQSQALSSLLLYSRCRTTGRLLSHYISI
ncbi:hypothetical protein LMH87_005568 [Akanthomyces muscarius]|uniref:Uncharacterized protein n=1 Tax=Akanthomyces muscarius TaxID=2231603 RepID=A0A9W8QP20_AKAMU|nr:hypothetical protein LMH87_005568 [Akanthomyces muscarius]KAJ4163864.1 hypothetical protein LMH87_005568 [Akanthomyces muscarius]